ncbi:DUF3857 domain-containing protein [Abyssalbus ytuae]|uniref:DUF3857 and transglutaminase domain-containing protein n=1 Tax=Abyssalbus ytuae TaxID=2926907 RepID=A0A9E6ZQV8_9FLAO|nr:DUF3857 domain-containing protein [Abyssalbus ytuae]UOB18830.1 DUF3857 and transglutaminase domain-containing protein [Abyssalbus ytuae]
MKYFIFIFLLSAPLSTSVFSQTYKFGKVSKEELEEKFNPKDSSAPATILYKKQRVYYSYSEHNGFEVITEVEERIKFYNKEGFDHATEQIYLYQSSDADEKISNIKGVTYNLENGKIVEKKLEKSAIFNEDASRYRKIVKFTMPDIREGTVVEFKYDIRSPFNYNIDEIPLQFDIPVKRIEVAVEIPEYYHFKPRIKGYYMFTPQSSKKSGVINFTNKSRSGGYRFSVTKTTYTNSKINYIIDVTNIDLDDVPALKEEKYVNNINNYRSSIKYELSFTKFPDGVIKSYSTTWEDVAKKIYQYDDFGGELSKTAYFESDINELINNIPGESEKAAAIFNYVKNKMAWNGYYGYWCNDGVRKAYKANTGNTGEINLMLISMFRYAGLTADPVLVSTRSHGIPLFPTREGFNYVICALKINNNRVLLDASSKYSSPGILPERTLNWQGRLIRKDGTSLEINLMPTQPSQQIFSLMYSLEDNGTVKGKIRNQYTNHHAFSFREMYGATKEEDYLEQLENNFGGIEIEEYEIKNVEDLSKPITESYAFIRENAYDAIGDKLYVSPLLFLAMDKNPFKLDKREYPVDFSFPRTVRYLVNIQLPEGYKVETLPEGSAVMLPDNLGAFKYNIANNGNILQVIVNHEINTAIVLPIYYDILKEYYKQLVLKQTEKIVLTKV